MARRSNSDDISNFHDYGIHIPTRTIRFPYVESDCDVNQDSIGRVITNFHILESMDKLRPITLILNSYGGDVYQALGLYDYIRSLESEVHIHAYGACMSAATLILQAGDKRLISENCTFMMHIGSEDLGDHSLNVRRWVKHSEKVTEPRMKEIYSYRMKRKPKESDTQLGKRIDQLLMLDTILTAEQVVELGLADELIPSRDYLTVQK